MIYLYWSIYKRNKDKEGNTGKGREREGREREKISVSNKDAEKYK